MEFDVLLKTQEDVTEFVSAASECDSDIDMKRGSMYLDAKSLLGVFSLGMKRKMRVICANREDRFYQRVRKFAIC